MKNGIFADFGKVLFLATKLLKKSKQGRLCQYLPFPQWLKITQNVAFELFDRKFQVFKNSPKMTVMAFFNERLSTENVSVTRFARNVKWDFFCDFQTLWFHDFFLYFSVVTEHISKVTNCFIPASIFLTAKLGITSVWSFYWSVLYAMAWF